MEKELYNKVLNVYSYGFNYIINGIINFKELDQMIEKSNLYFGKSIYVTNNISSEYITCLNEFFVDKLTPEQIAVLKDKKTVDNEVIEIIKKTLVNVLKKENVKHITYKYAIPERIIENGTIVLEFIYGKDTVDLSDDEFLVNYDKQQQFIEKLKEQIENTIREKLRINCVMLSSKEIK